MLTYMQYLHLNIPFIKSTFRIQIHFLKVFFYKKTFGLDESSCYGFKVNNKCQDHGSMKIGFYKQDIFFNNRYESTLHVWILY
jgi:hypothetical protein